MLRIIEDLGLETMTVADLIKELSSHDPDAPVFLQLADEDVITPADAVAAYEESELSVGEGWALTVSDVHHCEFDSGTETVVVLKAARPQPRCERCGAILLAHEASVCDSCEEMVAF